LADIAEEGTDMPLINFKAIEGVLAPEQKRELIEKLTDATASVYGEGIRQVTWVVIRTSVVVNGASPESPRPPLISRNSYRLARKHP
jgi:phenylpyruvate tautomerase PptA (4-oxalocrotonate tautomerase family)